jgi:hypothetical protein
MSGNDKTQNPNLGEQYIGKEFFVPNLVLSLGDIRRLSQFIEKDLKVVLAGGGITTDRNTQVFLNLDDLGGIIAGREKINNLTIFYGNPPGDNTLKIIELWLGRQYLNDNQFKLQGPMIWVQAAEHMLQIKLAKYKSRIRQLLNQCLKFLPAFFILALILFAPSFSTILDRGILILGFLTLYLLLYALIYMNNMGLLLYGSEEKPLSWFKRNRDSLLVAIYGSIAGSIISAIVINIL